MSIVAAIDNDVGTLRVDVGRGVAKRIRGIAAIGAGRCGQVVVPDGTATDRRPYHVQVIVRAAIDQMANVAWADVADGVAGGVTRPCSGETVRVFMAEP